MTGADAALEHVVRAEAALLVASLHRLLGDFDVAEEAVADAVVEALDGWRRTGVPERPSGWLYTAARHNAMDRLRREARYQDKLAQLAASPIHVVPATGDERLALIFACCHPTLPPPARLALTLRAVLGLTTRQIARAMLVPEATAAQRIVRAKRKIVAAGIRLRVPSVDQLPARLDSVLTVVYVLYNEAFLTTDPIERDLADDAIWLAGLVAELLPHEPEALGLLALLRLQHARASARFDAEGRLVLLAQQDRDQWDRAEMYTGMALLRRAAALHRPGRYQLEAAIAACHAEASSWSETDWLQVLTLYDLLVRHDPSPVVRLNRAIALSNVGGAAAALIELDELTEALRSYHLFHATRAQLLTALDRHAEARAANELALTLTDNAVERQLLTDRL